MIKWHLDDLIREAQAENPEATINRARIAQSTGLSTNALYKISSQKQTRVGLETLDLILGYFDECLERELSIDDLLHWEMNAERNLQ